MSRLNQKEKINKLAEIHGITAVTKLLFTKMIEESENGFLKNYTVFESKYVELLYYGNFTKYYESFLELQNIKKFIILDRTEDTLYIKLFSNKHYNNCLIDIKNKKRKYVKNPVLDKQGILNIMSTGKYGKIMSEALARIETDNITYATKQNGFKLPFSLMSYLKGEPLPIQNVNSLVKFNKEFLILEEQRRNLSKEDKRAYCACIAFSDSNGIIEDYNINSLVESINREFGEGAFSKSTMYDVIPKLLKLNLLEEFTNNKTGCKCLRVVNYKECFQNKERYVIIPNIVLTKVFKNLESAAICLFFDFLFLLNNGEDTSNKYVGQSKAIYFKIAKLDTDSPESKLNFEQQQAWLKKRYPGELRTLLWGDISDSEFLSLAEYFHFNCVQDTVLQVRIRREYFVSKQAEKLKKLLLLKGKNKIRYASIEETLKEHEIDYNSGDLISYIKIFKGASIKVIKTIFEQLADRITGGRQNGLPEIENPPAYVHTLYKNYKEGYPTKSPGLGFN